MADNILLRSEAEKDEEEEEEDREAEQELDFILRSGERVRDEESTSTSWCCPTGNARSDRPLSIQSGDIVRPSSPDLPKGWLYSILFPLVHQLTKIVLFEVRVRSTVVPVFAWFIIFISLAFSIGTAALSFVVFQPEFSISIKSFQVPDHPASQHWDGYQAAKQGHVRGVDDIAGTNYGRGFHGDVIGKDVVGRSLKPFDRDSVRRDIGARLEQHLSKRDSDLSLCTANSQTQHLMHTSWLMDIVYKVRDGSGANLLNETKIKYIHDNIEELIFTHPDYQNFCHIAQQSTLCDPINSVLTYFYPRDRFGNYIYPDNDGLTPDITATLSQLAGKLDVVLWYTGGQIGDNYNVPLLRSQVRIGVPLPCYSSYSDKKDEQHNRATNFLLSMASKYLENASTSDMEVLYGGTAIFDLEVNQAKIHDIKLGIVSIVLIFFALIILTGFSLTASIAAVVTIISCFPFAFFIYRVIFQYESLGLLNLISVFVIIGIGVDDVFVFLNTFKQSHQLRGLDTVHKRLAHTIIVAGKATFFTSITTSVAFFANAISMIPAVQQFGVFMGLVVFCCYVQVLTLLPPFLQIWHYFLLPFETSCQRLITFPCRRWRPQNYSALPSVRMTSLVDDDDSGIVQNGSTESSDTGSEERDSESPSSSVDSNLDTIGVIDLPLVASEETEVHSHRTQPPEEGWTGGDTSRKVVTNRLTVLTQSLMLFVARCVLVFNLLRLPPVTNNPTSRIKKPHQCLVNLGSVWIFCVVFVVSGNLMWQLKPTDHPPQFFDPNSNIQKMLDLTGNLTDLDTYNCWNCSNWYTGATTTAPPATTATPPSTTATHPSTTTTATTPTSHTTETPSTSTPPTDTPSTGTTHTPTTQPTDKPTTQPSSATPDGSSATTSGTQSSSSSPSIPTAPPPSQSSIFTNNVVVYAVFGIKGVWRNYSTAHVLPSDDGEGNFAILDPAFSGNLSCPPQPGAISLIGTFNALCRICRNISREENGLVLQENAQCFPSSASRYIQCFGISSLTQIPECRGLSFKDVSVSADGQIDYDHTSQVQSLRYMAMAFKSKTNINNSPFENRNDYRKWEAFFQSEMEEIKKLSGPNQPYEGAYGIISSGFQTTQYWQELNTELAAVFGSIYGIVISFILCSLVVVILSHDWRIVVSMFLTIIGIIVTLLGLFKIFGWSLGIVEAISLSILVGNSLDYCIHLSEGYLATDSRHLAFLQRFTFTSRATIREKRVMASIAFIGVSIVSSAITTILAIMPILFTQIQLFKRFGEILILDTLIAIIYTLVFCSSFLSFFGPKGSESPRWRILNATLTIVLTFMGYGFLFMVLYFVNLGVTIPGPSGEPLFN